VGAREERSGFGLGSGVVAGSCSHIDDALAALAAVGEALVPSLLFFGELVEKALIPASTRLSKTTARDCALQRVHYS